MRGRGAESQKFVEVRAGVLETRLVEKCPVRPDPKENDAVVLSKHHKDEV